MYKLASKSVDFNSPYMILTKMISAAQQGYMLYGLPLTQVFEYFHCDLLAHPHFYVNAMLVASIAMLYLLWLQVLSPIPVLLMLN